MDEYPGILRRSYGLLVKEVTLRPGHEQNIWWSLNFGLLTNKYLSVSYALVTAVCSRIGVHYSVFWPFF